MDFRWLVLLALSAAPFSEARGAILYGLAAKLNPLSVLLAAFVINICIIPVVFYLLQLSHFRYWAFRLFGKSAKKKVNKRFEILRELALLGFVAVPLPITGAYTGILISELLGWNWKKSFLAISGGVAIASLLVWASALGLIRLFSL